MIFLVVSTIRMERTRLGMLSSRDGFVRALGVVIMVLYLPVIGLHFSLVRDEEHIT